MEYRCLFRGIAPPALLALGALSWFSKAEECSRSNTMNLLTNDWVRPLFLGLEPQQPSQICDEKNKLCCNLFWCSGQYWLTLRNWFLLWSALAGLSSVADYIMITTRRYPRLLSLNYIKKCEENHTTNQSKLQLWQGRNYFFKGSWVESGWVGWVGLVELVGLGWGEVGRLKELRSSKVKLMWWVRRWWYEMITKTGRI